MDTLKINQAAKRQTSHTSLMTSCQHDHACGNYYVKHRKYSNVSFYGQKHEWPELCGCYKGTNISLPLIPLFLKHLCCITRTEQRSFNSLINHMKEGNAFWGGHIPGSMYRRKMALVSSLTQFWSFPAQRCREWTSIWLHMATTSRLFFLPMAAAQANVVSEQSRCRPKSLSDLQSLQRPGHVVYIYTCWVKRCF